MKKIAATLLALLGVGFWSNFNERETHAQNQTSSSSYYFAPMALPNVVEAENFDNGGEGVAYHDSDVENHGGSSYRDTTVDVYTYSDAGTMVGWAYAGEWLNYTVSVASDGVYNIDAVVASPGEGGAFHIEIDGVDVTGAVAVPNTGSWGNYQIQLATNAGVSLAAGEHIVRVVLDTNGTAGAVANFDYFKFSLSSNESGGDSGAPPTSSGSYSLSLDGAGAYAEVPDNPSLNLTGSLTLEAWIKTNSETAQQGIIERFTDTGGGYALRLNSGKVEFYVIGNGGNDYDYVQGNTSVSSGVWHHVVGVYDGYEYRVYLDGVLDNAKAATMSPASGTGSLKIGARGIDATHTFNGLIDEVRITPEAIYKTDFTPSYKASLSVLTENIDGSPRGLWNFDTQTVGDSTAYSNYGTVQGSASFSSDVPTINSTGQLAVQNTPGTSYFVGFDYLYSETPVTNQFPKVSFSSFYGIYFLARSFFFNGSLTTTTPNALISSQTQGSNYASLVINFAEPMKDVSFDVCAIDGYGPVCLVDVYQNGSFFRQYQINGVTPFQHIYSVNFTGTGVDRITKIHIHSVVDENGLTYDSFRYTTNPLPTCGTEGSQVQSASAPCNPGSYNAEGFLDPVSSNGLATGFAFDRDVPATPVYVDFYVDGTAAANKVGTTLANLPRAGVPVPGNHGFSFQIPDKFKDGKPHTLYAVALDKTANNNTSLAPRTFTITPLQSIAFETIDGSFVPLDANPAPMGGGLRIFPDAKIPTDTVNRARVVAKVTGAPNTTIYFRSFDPDDPSNAVVGAAVDPNDANNIPTADDNKTLTGVAGALPRIGSLSAPSKTLDASGTGSVELTVGKFPGNNYIVAASSDASYLNTLKVKGTTLTDASGNAVDQNKVKVTPMLSVWRRLHVEVDSMGIVSGNIVSGTVMQGNRQTTKGDTRIYVNQTLEPGRFQGGRIIITGHGVFPVITNTYDALGHFVTISGSTPNAFVGAGFTLYDDDDYNSNTDLQADNGEDVEPLIKNPLTGNADATMFDTVFNLMQDSPDPTKNCFADAYIQPSYSYAQSNNFNNKNIPFNLNVDLDRNSINTQLGTQRGKSTLQGTPETDDFWTVYIQLAYQPGIDRFGTSFPQSVDGDPDSEDYISGIVLGFTIDAVTGWQGVPAGGHGSLVFLETLKDSDRSYPAISIERLRTTPHETAHQLGVKGDTDSRDPNQSFFGIMSYNNIQTRFVASHINVMRWRVKSPGF